MYVFIKIRGGVKDKRFKAKDTKKSEAMPKGRPSEDKPSRGEGQECSRPRPRTQRGNEEMFTKKKGLRSKNSQIFSKMQAISKTKPSLKNLQVLWRAPVKTTLLMTLAQFQQVKK